MGAADGDKSGCSCCSSIGTAAASGDGGVATAGRALSARDVLNWPAEIPFSRQPALLSKDQTNTALIKAYSEFFRFDPHTTPGTKLTVLADNDPKTGKVKVRNPRAQR